VAEPRPMPAALRWSLVVFVGLIGIVRWEPAPADLLFPLVALALAFARPVWRGMSAVSLFGAGLFVFANLVSMLSARSPVATMRYAAISFYLLAAWWVLAVLFRNHGRRAERLVVRAFVCSATVAAIIGILAKYRLIPGSGLFLMDEAGTRVTGPFKDANVFGPFLAMAITLLLAGWVERGERALLRLGLTAVLLFGLFLSFSRGAYANLAAGLGVFAALVVFGIQRRDVTRRLVGVTVAAGVVLVPVALYVIAATDLGEFLHKRMALQEYDNHRFATHGLALEVALAEPLGIGPGEWTSDRFGLATHNVYLRVVAENGWLGLCAFLIFCAGAIGSAIRSACRGGPVAVTQAAIAGVLIANLLESVIIDSLHWRHLFVAMGFATGLAALENAASAAVPGAPDRALALPSASNGLEVSLR
jgi:O-antigen ligase